MRSAALLCLLLAGLLCAPAVATAQERGVIVDPGSPAGREYALPLEAARRDAAADPAVQGRKLPPAAQTSPPFGVGIEPRGGRRSPSAGGDSRGADADGAAANRGTAAAGVDGSNLSTSLPILALSLGLLVAGALLGFAVRRVTPRDPGA